MAADLLTSNILRVIQLLLSLLAIRLTFDVLSDKEFIYFNLILFALGALSAVMSPRIRKIWIAQSNKNVRVALFSAILWSALLSVALGYYSDDIAVSAILITSCAFLYLSSRAVERIGYATLMQKRKTISAFMISISFIVGELITIGTFYGGYVQDFILGARLAFPAVLFWIAFFIIAPRYLSGKRPDIGAIESGQEKTRDIVVITYMIFVTLASLIERLLAPFLFPGPALQRALAEFLLILSYGVALQSLLQVTSDWLRPRVMVEGQYARGAKAHSLVAIGAIMSFTLFAVVAGFGVFQLLKLLPRDADHLLWALVMGRFGALALLALSQIDLVLKGRMVRAAMTWVGLVLCEVGALWQLSAGWDLGRYAISALLICCVFAAMELPLMFLRMRENAVAPAEQGDGCEGSAVRSQPPGSG